MWKTQSWRKTWEKVILAEEQLVFRESCAACSQVHVQGLNLVPRLQRLVWGRTVG